MRSLSHVLVTKSHSIRIVKEGMILKMAAEASPMVVMKKAIVSGIQNNPITDHRDFL